MIQRREKEKDSTYIQRIIEENFDASPLYVCFCFALIILYSLYLEYDVTRHRIYNT